MLSNLGIKPDETKEVIPIYLDGLLDKFKDIRNMVENKIEDFPENVLTLQEVVEIVERKANKRSLLKLTSKGRTVSQNVADAKDAKGKKGKKGGNNSSEKGKGADSSKSHENTVKQLKSEIKKLKEGKPQWSKTPKRLPFGTFTMKKN